ncbi:MFS transporter [Aquabacterium humicola]|uniref:MFS transporter n=1 Tax=Aquabacterium humicola TaxID=3237377 RepID=UPI0025434145|nr:MFS transporter [Rubrivivax pictus]
MPPPVAPFAARATLPVTLLVQSAASAAALAPTVAAPQLLAALQLKAVAVGIYIALVYFAAMFSSQWGAALVRRWGPLRTSQAALASCAFGLALMNLPQLPAALAGALLIGVGYGPMTPASSEMLARTTRPERYALVFSIKQTGVPLGGAIAGLLVPPLLGRVGMGGMLAAMALLCGLGIVLAQPLRGVLDAARDPAAPWPTPSRMAGPVRRVLAHPVLRRIALCTLVFSAVQVSLTSYTVTFLTAELHWTLVAAGVALSVAQGGGVAGRIAWGWVADGRAGAARTLIGLALAMALLGGAMALLTPATPPWPAMGLLAAYGATAIGWNGVYLATVARLVTHDEAAAATSGSLFFTYFGVVLGPPLFGAIGTASGSLGTAFALLALPLAWTVWTLKRAGIAP